MLNVSVIFVLGRYFHGKGDLFLHFVKKIDCGEYYPANLRSMGIASFEVPSHDGFTNILSPHDVIAILSASPVFFFKKKPSRLSSAWTTCLYPPDGGKCIIFICTLEEGSKYTVSGSRTFCC